MLVFLVCENINRCVCCVASFRVREMMMTTTMITRVLPQRAAVHTAAHARSTVLLRLLRGFHSMVIQCTASRFIQEAANSNDGIGIL